MNQSLSTTEQALLSLLSDHQFHSGDKLASHFAVTRSAISNWVKHIKQMGIDILSVKGKGYQLAPYISMLDPEILRAQLSPLLDIAYKVSDTSTNDSVKTLLKQNRIPCLAITEQQTAGRGRRGRDWISPFGQNLYFTLGMEFNLAITQLSGLSLAVGLSLAEALNEANIPVQLKWPNDLYLAGQKVAGILVELDGAFDSPCRVVIGVGLNANMPMNNQLDQQIGQAWTSIASYMGYTVNRTELVCNLVTRMMSDIEHFSENGLALSVDRWNELDYYYQQPVRLISPNNEIKGIAMGIDDTGALLIETDKGIERHVAGEISVRPLSVGNVEN